MSTTSAVFQLSKLGCRHVAPLSICTCPSSCHGLVLFLPLWWNGFVGTLLCGRPWSSISSTAIATTGAKQTQCERVLLPNMKQNPAEDENDKSLWTGSNMALVRPNWRIDVDMSMDGTHNCDHNNVSCFEQTTNPVTGTHGRTMNAVLLDDAIEWMEA